MTFYAFVQWVGRIPGPLSRPPVDPVEPVTILGEGADFQAYEPLSGYCRSRSHQSRMYYPQCTLRFTL